MSLCPIGIEVTLLVEHADIDQAIAMSSIAMSSVPSVQFAAQYTAQIYVDYLNQDDRTIIINRPGVAGATPCS